MRNRYQIIVLFVCLIACSSLGPRLSSAKPEPEPPAGINFRLIIPLYGQEELTLVDKYLRAGDMVVLYPPRPELKASGLPQQPDYWVKKAKEFKTRAPKVETIFNFDGIEGLREWTPKLPPEVDWVSYDYEKWEWTPEYGPDQQHTLRYFQEARRIVHRHRKRLFLTPVPFFNEQIIEWVVKSGYLAEKIRPWDFAAVAKAGDAFNAQFQFFLRDTAWVQSTVSAMSAELERRSPDTLFFVQVGSGSGRTPYTDEELKKAIDAIVRSGADGIVVWFGPGRSSWGEKVLRMIRGER